MNPPADRPNAPVPAGRAFFFALAILAFAPSCGRAPAPAEADAPVRAVADATGTLVPVPLRPARIVSLIPSATEALFRLGAGDRVVGVTTFCTRPEEAKALPKAGSYLVPNIETILALDPDLVIASKEGVDPGPFLRLRALGLNLFFFPSLDGFEKVRDAYALLGRLVAAEDEARRGLGEVDRRLEAVRLRLAGRTPLSTLVVVGSNPLVTAGPGSCVHDVLLRSGAVNAAAGLGRGYPRVDLEVALGFDPEAILITTMTGFPEEERQRWLGFTSLRAVRDGRVFLVNGDDICRPDPFAFAAAVEEVAGKLHPDASKPEAREE